MPFDCKPHALPLLQAHLAQLRSTMQHSVHIHGGVALQQLQVVRKVALHGHPALLGSRADVNLRHSGEGVHLIELWQNFKRSRMWLQGRMSSAASP